MLSTKHGGWQVPTSAFPKWMPKAAAGVLLVGGVVWYFLQPKTYDECMLAEMRGQAQALYSTVHKVCARRFGLEVPSPLDLRDGGLAWFVEDDGKVSVTFR